MKKPPGNAAIKSAASNKEISKGRKVQLVADRKDLRGKVAIVQELNKDKATNPNNLKAINRNKGRGNHRQEVNKDHLQTETSDLRNKGRDNSPTAEIKDLSSRIRIRTDHQGHHKIVGSAHLVSKVRTLLQNPEKIIN